MPVEPGPPVFAPDGRQILPNEGYAIDGYKGLLAVRTVLIEAGNELAFGHSAAFWQLYGKDDGFEVDPSGWTCHLRDPITPEDWAMLQTRFVFPVGITYGIGGMIRDGYNYVDLIGGATIVG